MIKNLLFFVLFAGCINLFSQTLSKEQLNKLYSELIESKNVASGINYKKDQKPVKCGFVLANSVKAHFNEFTNYQQQILKPLLTRPYLQTSIVSPSGFFRIHYDTSGINRPNYSKVTDTLPAQILFTMYLDSVALAADSAYNFEINKLAYPPPPPDDTAGGDSKYDIYLEKFSGYYGDTQFDGNKGPSYMEVNSDFTGFPTEGIDAVRVTVAHEFHHGIQVGNYIYRDSDAWFHEMTSTSFEHFVYPSIHDYYNYMDTYFSSPERSLARNNTISGGNDGYDIAIWNIYLQKKFDFDVIKRQWELMPSMRAVETINQSIIEKGGSFKQILNEFGIWVYFTDGRAQQGKYFTEAGDYPPITFPVSNILQFPPYAAINNFNNPVSNNFFQISIRQNSVTDILVPVITNSDYEAAVINTESTFNFQYLLFNYNSPGTTSLVGKYFSQLNITGLTWFNSEILNNTWLGSTEVFNHDADFAFPSPFNYSYPVLYIPVDQNSSNIYELNVYSIGMKLVYSSTLSPTKLDDVKPVLEWNGKNNNSQKLSSGVYIYAVKSGTSIKKGKIVIFNE
jgi:hypothetical protein